MRNLLLSLIALLAFSVSARGQFYTSGTDPGYLRWYSVESPYYKIIYPEGADSLARTYARLLEQFRVPVSRSIDHLPKSGKWGKRMPVVLHTHNLYSNGSVGYAPVRMDFFTMPEASGSEPVPWPVQLAAHEPRHQAQLEKLESTGLAKGLSYVVGQGAAPLAWVVYLAAVRGEGDAVAAETGLAYGTRARTADFLGYMRVAFDQGDWRSLVRWSKGSYKYFAPDYYKAGYMLMGGTRYLYNRPSFTEDGLEIHVKKPWLVAPFNYNKLIRNLSGKSANDSFQDVMHAFNDVWQADAAARAPFLDLQQITSAESFPLTFNSPRWIDGTLYALRSGYLRTCELVSIRDGKVKALRPFSGHTSSLAYDPVRRRLYWSELVPDKRWTLSGTSPIRFMDMKTHKVKDLARGKRYFNPQPSDDGNRLAVAEYVTTGETYLVVLSASDGSVLRRQQAPEGVQLTESAWLGEELYCAGISMGGYGIYRALPSGEWEEVLAPSHQKLVNLDGENGGLEWVSDRTGVNELYHYSPADGRLSQITNTHYGATDFCWADDQLYCVSQTRDGELVFSIPVNALKPREVSFTDLHTYVIEDALTEQERALGPGPDFTQEVPLSAPKRYHKLSHLLQLHTWVPAYANADAIMNSSFDFTYENLSPGLTGFFQNTLGTFSGQAGFAFHPNPDQERGWRSALHAKFTYTGLYPAIEAQLDFGDRRARQYNYLEIVAPGYKGITHTASLRDVPLLSGHIRAYIPWASRKGGLLYGFIPQVKYGFTNHVYGLDPMQFTLSRSIPGVSSFVSVSDIKPEDRNVFAQTLSLSARGYVMQPTAKSMIYPRYGIGVETGVSVRPWTLSHFRPVVFGYTYAYLPGLWRTQGLKLTGTIQRQLGRAPFGDISVAVLPRGFDSAANTFLYTNYLTQWKVTADYAIPIFLGDLSIPVLGYIRNFVLTPHADFLGLGKDNLWSAGADLVADMGQIFFLSTDVKLGVSFSWLGGNIYEKTEQKKPYSVSLILSFDI